jgi:hypothetical protein
MGHEVSQEAPLDPDLAAENALLDLVPLMDELLARVSCRAIPQPQSTSALTDRAHVEELLAGNNQ